MPRPKAETYRSERYREWHPNNLNEERVAKIAEAYFLCDMNPIAMGKMLELPFSLEPAHLAHPLVRRAIVVRVVDMRKKKMYTREEHVEKLKEIRDMCLGDNQFKNGLAAEIALGRAAGLYENIGAGGDDLMKEDKPEALTSDQIRARLAKLQEGNALPAPAASRVIDHPPQPSQPRNGDAF